MSNYPPKPNYFVIGAAKAASSTVCTLLGRHPDVFMVECKEPCFFNEDRHYFERGWSWYESLYEPGTDCVRRGEGSNNYTMKELWPATAERIYQAAHDAKLIYVVREPFSRIESFWMQRIANGDRDTHPEFNQAVRERPDIFVESTNYLRQLDPYLERFDRDQIRVVFYEDFRRDSVAVMSELFVFLDVDPSLAGADPAPQMNPSEGKLVYSSSLIRLRRATWLAPAKRLLPDGLKQSIADRFFRKPQTGRPEWTAATRSFVRDRLASDTEEFCERWSGDRDRWNLKSV